MTDLVMNYAPVVIPTLCRVECFIPCIESLVKCVGAECTDVYIALDYPLNESHWDGYRRIVEYLDNTKFPFKSLNVIKRHKNYGVYGPNSNFNMICDDLWKIYDRLIFSEDDNLFSPNFLLYVNKGLELFEYDYTIDSICGYLNYNGIKSNRNTFYRCPNYFSAWGYGTWRSRINERKKISTEYFKKSFSIRTLINMSRLGRARFLAYLSAMCPTHYLWVNDVVLSTYLVLEGKYQIVPTISLVKNIGVESGENFSQTSKEIANLYLKQTISLEHTFEFIGSGYEFQEENVKDWVYNEKQFHEKFHWITWDIVIKQTIRRTIKILLGCFGWKPRKSI